MYLVTLDGESKQVDEQKLRGEAEIGGLARLVWQVWRRWKARGMRQRRRDAKRQMFLVESMVLGPKQRVVLMRCGAERFLVGMSAEGITSVVRVGMSPGTSDLPLASGADGHWG
jgi:flagellar biogenesis protein FliO